MLNLDKTLVAYASITVGLSILNHPFNFFYVKIFLEVFKVRESHFHMAQTLFMVWNAVNDPLFAYLLDNSSFACFRSRRRSLMFGAPLLGASFMLTWFSWGSPGSWLEGVHLIVALSMYDSLFTFVALAQCALFTELSTCYKRRLDTKRYAVVGGLLVSWSVSALNLVSGDLTNLFAFRTGCLALTLVSAACVYYGGSHLHSKYDSPEDTIELKVEDIQEAKEPAPMSPTKSTADTSAMRQIRDIVLQRDFLAFVCTNFLQIFEATMWHNFMPIFITRLGPSGTGVRSAVYLLVHVLPMMTMIFGLSVVKRLGHYRVIMMTIFLKIVAGPSVYLIGAGPWLFVTLAVLSCWHNSLAFGLYDMTLSEIADQDMRRHSRPYPLSSMVFGTNALVTKPAISLAPMLVVSIMNRFGYATAQENDGNEALTGAMLQLCCLLPAGLGLLQLLCWRMYRIRPTAQQTQ